MSGVTIISSPTHSHVPMSLRIPRDPHDSRGFPWNFFRTPDSAREWISFQNHHSRWPTFGGLPTNSLCDRFEAPTSRGPLGYGHINFWYPASGRAWCDGFEGYPSWAYRACITYWASGLVLGFLL